MVAVLVTAGFSFTPGEAAGQAPILIGNGTGVCRFDDAENGVTAIACFNCENVLGANYNPGCPDGDQPSVGNSNSCEFPCSNSLNIQPGTLPTGDDIFDITIWADLSQTVKAYEARVYAYTYTYDGSTNEIIITWDSADEISVTIY